MTADPETKLVMKNVINAIANCWRTAQGVERKLPCINVLIEDKDDLDQGPDKQGIIGGKL